MRTALQPNTMPRLPVCLILPLLNLHLPDSRSIHTDPIEEGKKKLSKRQRKMISQLKIAELKQLAERPDVVEVWDVTSPDPQMLVFLKVCPLAAQPLVNL